MVKPSTPERRVIAAKTVVAALGGESGVGRDMEPAAIAALRAAAARDGVPMVEMRPLRALLEALMERVTAATGGAVPAVAINIGGALIGTGSCRESYEFPPGLTKAALSCTGGTPGLVMRLGMQGVPVLHVLNMRRMAVEMGLPFDPEPLPVPGDNTAVYGTAQRNAN